MTTVKDIVSIKFLKQVKDNSFTVNGWFRFIRKQSNQCFGQLYDGSCATDLQVVFLKKDIEEQCWATIKSCDNGASVQVTGQLVDSPGQGQKYELKATQIKIYGQCDATVYALSPKKGFTLEYLRQHPHLRSRTRIMQCVMRIRATLDFATHQFFRIRGFLRLHTPILTSNDCEGAGEVFSVQSDARYEMAKRAEERAEPAQSDEERMDRILKLEAKRHFFGKPTYLTVSGQLNAETYACGMGPVYTFGPTFRAENSNTYRHLAEFWMIEPEVPFMDLHGDMQLAEDYVQYCIRAVLSENVDDLRFLEEKQSEGLINRLRVVADGSFVRCTYTEAVERLKQYVDEDRVVFEDNKIFWGMDLSSEHEKFLVDVVFEGRPVILFNYPSDIKSFYMTENPPDKEHPERRTVAAMDVLISRIGELIGGSQRETDLEILLQKMQQKNLDPAEYREYLDLRRFGNVPHSGFGLGFERLVMLTTGITNIRDTIPFPRFVGKIDF